MNVYVIIEDFEDDEGRGSVERFVDVYEHEQDAICQVERLNKEWRYNYYYYKEVKLKQKIKH